MIHWKKKDFNAPPAKLETQRCIAQIRKAVESKDGNKYTATYYKSEEVLNLLRAFSINKDSFDENCDEAKCYYCESFAEHVVTLQVEHYRPKAAIHDEERNSIPGTNGYYWLGCEWSNLVLACPKCNGRGAKGNKFPIQGERVVDDTPFSKYGGYDRRKCLADNKPLVEEKPYLLHPEIDDARRYLKFNENGKIGHKNIRGRETIKLCKLDRPQLNIERNKIKKSIMSDINLLIWQYENGIIETKEKVLKSFIFICSEIRKCNQPNKPYTLWARYFNHNYEECFVSEVPEEYKPLLRQAFIDTKNLNAF